MIRQYNLLVDMSTNDLQVVSVVLCFGVAARVVGMTTVLAEGHRGNIGWRPVRLVIGEGGGESRGGMEGGRGWTGGARL